MEGLFQPTHLLVIFLIALIIFGPKKLPELGKGIGEGFRAPEGQHEGKARVAGRYHRPYLSTQHRN
jgi:TatA/E family protein of Tat protein translocase